MGGKGDMSGPRLKVSSFRQSINVLGCCIVAYLYAYLLFKSTNAATLDILVAIFLAEYNRWSNENRRQQCGSHRQEKSSLALLEQSEISPDCSVDMLATIVGFREDPPLFTNCLKSYIGASGCKFLLVCVDGDTKLDEEMTAIFQEVSLVGAVFPEATSYYSRSFPTIRPASASISPWPSSPWMINNKPPLKTSMGKLHANLRDQAEIVLECRKKAKAALEAANITFRGHHAITYLCINQRHMHKKGIMFTAFIFSLVICDILGIEFIWSSDSDSWILRRDTLQRTVSTMASAPTMGGASTALSNHNAKQTAVTQLANAMYFSELYLARSSPGAGTANECQSGPCAIFRTSALEVVLLNWYRQTVFGHWMITNEDRHLTTCLLLSGWHVTFVADVTVSTETPPTLKRYLLQQVRWARAVHVEILHRPSVYALQSPLLFFSGFKRMLSGSLIPSSIFYYLITGRVLVRAIEVPDLTRRVIINLLYLLLRNPDRGQLSTWLWILPSAIFSNSTLPAVNLWAFTTISSDSWGVDTKLDAHLTSTVRLKRAVFEYGHFVIWVAILSGSFVRFGALGWELTHVQSVAFICMNIVFGLVSALILIIKF